MPCLRAKKAMGAPFDFVAAIETAAILKPMKIIAHDRGVICPAFRRRRHIVVPVKKADPVSSLIDSRHADQFRTETRHNDAKAGLFVSKNVQIPTTETPADLAPTQSTKRSRRQRYTECPGSRTLRPNAGREADPHRAWSGRWRLRQGCGT